VIKESSELPSKKIHKKLFSSGTTNENLKGYQFSLFQETRFQKIPLVRSGHKCNIVPQITKQNEQILNWEFGGVPA
jgi:hypothetical protein